MRTEAAGIVAGCVLFYGGHNADDIRAKPREITWLTALCDAITCDLNLFACLFTLLDICVFKLCVTVIKIRSQINHLQHLILETKH